MLFTLKINNGKLLISKKVYSHATLCIKSVIYTQPRTAHIILFTYYVHVQFYTIRVKIMRTIFLRREHQGKVNKNTRKDKNNFSQVNRYLFI